jgi:hypothetical protein
MASPQTVALPEPEIERVETVHPLPQPERKETPFVIRLAASVPV